MRLRAGIAAAAVLLATGATAQQADGDWHASRDDAVCWNATAPLETTGAPSGRGDAYLAVVTDPAEDTREVSVVSGLEDISGASAVATIDGQSFDLLPYGGAAFPRGGDPENAMLDGMRRGSRMTVTWKVGSSTIVDTFSLMGFSRTRDMAEELCKG